LDLRSFTLTEIRERVAHAGEPVFRAEQIFRWLHGPGTGGMGGVRIPLATSTVPRALRDALLASAPLTPLVPDGVFESADGTRKFRFRTHDGRAIETVLIPDDKQERSKLTVCISSQAGCAMGCVFCATGQMGFKRHLTSGEIVAQVMYYARLLFGETKVVTNVVLMGMGEPFHNYENTLAAIDRLNDPHGYNFGARRFTISTVGLVPAIRRFAAEKRQINLAISLHAAEDELRTSMLPLNRRYPIDELLDACQEYIALTGRRITFEWALINEVNDTPEQAILLAKKLKGMLCHVNAIPLNPTLGYSGQATSRERAEQFKQILDRSGIPCTIRLRRGIDIQAGCGQLAIQV